ncbi:cyclic nucleotide-binding domain-containing protein [Sphingomonas sp. 1P06PA]|uniref:cyclic nucleotide-binding domain-containing protein n=1 Tax=Sphingomonas sp. 1P06PA TaxID=554121 RepID=UPI0039A5EE0F
MGDLLGTTGLWGLAALAGLAALLPHIAGSRVALAVMAIALAALAWADDVPFAGALFLAGAGVALFQAALLAIRNLRLRFNPEEQRMVESAFGTLDRRQARQLIDQGVWLDGKAGEVLTREGEPVGNLFYLADGTAAVSSRGMWIATATAPTLVGEMTVLDQSGATATVSLDGAARMWCVDGPALRRFLKENPDIRMALENSFFGSLIAKLRSSNMKMAEAGGLPRISAAA